jgi:putative PIN family toxin of toxin-antitoxin system
VKVFLDTNVLASSIATRGLCSELLESILHERELLTSREVLRELERVLDRKLRLPGLLIAGFLEWLDTETRLIEAQAPPSVPIKDAADIPILASAIAGAADVFVTGDRELLALGKVEGVAIVSPRELWLRLAGPAGKGKPK